MSSTSTGPQPQPRLELPVNPADAGIAVALRAAGRYWAATPANWVLPVVAVALVNLLAVLVLGSATISTAQIQGAIVTGPQGPDLDMEQLPRLVAGPVAVGVVTLVARWFLLANAIAGLRGRELSMGWIAGAGVKAFAADMLVSLAFVSLSSIAFSMGPAGLLVVATAAPFAIYAGIRLTFWSLAIFDGSSLSGGATTSWRITRRAVLRVLGWTLALAAIGFLAGLPLLLLDLALPSQPAVRAVAGGVLEMVLAAWTIVVVAVLYESQRLRTDPVAYQASLADRAPSGPPPSPDEPRGPFDPPPPPG